MKWASDMTLAGFPRIAVDPAICGGRPVIAGMRVRVTDILEMLAGGAGVDEIVADFPYLGADDVRAALDGLNLQGDLNAIRRNKTAE